MPPYQEKETKSLNILRFIRINRDIFVGNKLRDSHRDIVQMDNLEEKINDTLKTQPEEVDAGFISYYEDKVLFVSDKSGSLDLPVLKHQDKARVISVKDFQEQSPNYKVRRKSLL